MPDRLIARADLDFLLHDWLDTPALLRRPAFDGHSRETVDAMLDTSAHLAATLFLPHYKKSDREEPRLTAHGVAVLPEVRPALAAYAEAGLISAALSPEHGGLGLPHSVHSAAMGLFMAANTATAGYAMLTAANTRLLTDFGTPAQIEAFAAPQVAGSATGTMCLSEPQAGSSLADIRTRAQPDGEDALGARYRLVGNKMWISGGDHDAADNIIHLVLAKVPGPDGQLVPGTRGISLFVVPKRLPPGVAEDGTANDVAVAGLNHKMGFRGTANCLLNFGERGGALGWLVGSVGQGLPIMFQMMNEARIGVGLGAAVLGCRGYLLALDYARERTQGRPLGAKDAASSPVPIIQHPDVRRMLLAQKAYAEGALALVLYCARLVDDARTADTEAERSEAEALLGLLTPVAKAWPSEWALAANDLAIQVHGGYGYTRDFDVEQLYRDNRLNPIHEGTTGIQAIDLLGRKLLRDTGAGFAVLRRRVARTVGAAGADPALAGHGAALLAAWEGIADVTAQLKRLNDGAQALHNATPFLSAFGHAVVAWLWLDQAVAASGVAPLHVGKRRACRFFYEFELPKVAPLLAAVASLTDVASGMPEEAF